MNHRPSGETRHESPPKPDSNESKTSKSRRHNKRGHRRSGRASAAASIEKPVIDSDGRREYSAESLREAVIWVRDIDNEDKSIQPLIDTRRSDAQTPGQARDEQVEHPVKKETPMRQKTSKPSVEKPIVPPIPAVRSGVESYPDHMPPRRPERTYFWNQAEKYRPTSREVLPAVKDVSQAEPAVVEQKSVIDTTPSLEQAINPNEPHAKNVAADPADTKPSAASNSESKPGIMARRRAKRTVQSQTMEGETFERITPQPFPELAAAEADYDEEPTAFAADAGYAAAEQAPEKTLMSDFGSNAESGSTEFTKAKNSVEQGGTSEALTDHEFVDATLDRSRILELAQSIRIDGVSVYEMFTAKRIDEAGLRRIISEYLRGGDLRDVITGEVIRQQLKFERDPQLRGMPITNTESGGTKRAVSSLKNRTKSLVDPERRRDRSEKLAELTQIALEKSQELFNDKPKAGRVVSIVAIVVIYLAILIVALAK